MGVWRTTPFYDTQPIAGAGRAGTNEPKNGIQKEWEDYPIFMISIGCKRTRGCGDVELTFASVRYGKDPKTANFWGMLSEIRSEMCRSG